VLAFYDAQERLSVRQRTHYELSLHYKKQLTTKEKAINYGKLKPFGNAKLECALNCENPDERASHLAALESMSEVSLGNYLLEICYSVDHKFCALQLNQFQHLRFEPVSPVCFFEAGEAQQVMRAL
jgi:hypothetical protein